MLRHVLRWTSLAALATACLAPRDGTEPEAALSPARVRTTSWLAVGDRVGRAEVFADEREVVLSWQIHPEGAFRGARTATGTQAIPVDFRPTALDLSGDAVLIAGEREGRTRIERWSLAAPALVADPGGLRRPALADARIERVEVLLDEAVPGRGPVLLLCFAEGSSERALVLFRDSRELFELRAGAGSPALTRLLSPDGADGVPAEPALAGPFDRCVRGDHSTAGYVYTFEHLDGFGADPLLALFDRDRDGTIDDRAVYAAPAWARAFGDQAAWLSLGGKPMR